MDRQRAGQAVECVEKILAGEVGVADAKLAELSALIAAMQESAGAEEGYTTDPGLVDDFIIEAREQIELGETALLALEADPEGRDSINAVFRAFHTIKGSSQFLHFKAICEVAHKAETLLVRVREGELRLTELHADLALEAVDILKQMVGELEQNPGGPPPAAPSAVNDLLARLEHPEFEGLGKVDDPADPPRLGDLLAASSDVTREDIERAVGEQGEGRLGEALIRSGKVTTTQVARALRTQRKLEAQDRSEDTVRVSTQRLDKLVNMVGELVITNAMIHQHP
ncbi:MAG: Hpt domain-containing protein, partial [Planctomycetota bacterium]